MPPPKISSVQASARWEEGLGGYRRARAFRQIRQLAEEPVSLPQNGFAQSLNIPCYPPPPCVFAHHHGGLTYEMFRGKVWVSLVGSSLYSRVRVILPGKGIVVKEVVLFQDKKSSRPGVFVDWQALVAKVPGVRLTQISKTHCTIMLPEEKDAALDWLLHIEYQNVRRRPRWEKRAPRTESRTGTVTITDVAHLFRR